MKRILLLTLSVLAAVDVSARAVFNFDDYHKDGADYFETMSKIVELVRARNGEPCVVKMSGGKYVAKKSKNFGAFIYLNGISNLEIDGCGAKVRINQYNEFCFIEKSRNIVVKNFDFALSKPAFAQGEIVEVFAESFTFKVDKGYPLPPSNEFTLKTYPDEKWRWGSVMDRKTRALKAGAPDHLFVESVEKVGKRLYRVFMRKDYISRMHSGTGVAVGDVWVMPVYKEKNPRRDANVYSITVVKSKDVLVENVRVSATKHAGFASSDNYGKTTFRKCVLTWRDGSADMISSWRDGAHCKNNRVGPTFDGCVFEGLLDDSINISSAPAFVVKKTSDTVFQMRRWVFGEGDRVSLLFGDAGRWCENAFTAAKGSNGFRLCVEKPFDFKLWKPISQYDIVSGNSHANATATQFFNMEYVNSGFEVKNCRFGIQRRSSMIIRARDGAIENNFIDGGSGVVISNEMGSWFEGPIPRNILVRNNTVKVRRHSPAVRIGSMLGKPDAHADFDFGITFEGNKLYTSSPDGVSMEVFCCNGLRGGGNAFYFNDGRSVDASRAVRVRNSQNIDVR